MNKLHPAIEELIRGIQEIDIESLLEPEEDLQPGDHVVGVLTPELKAMSVYLNKIKNYMGGAFERGLDNVKNALTTGDQPNFDFIHIRQLPP